MQPSTDHAVRMVRKMLQQHRTRPRIVALVQALAAGVQALEDDVDDLIALRTIADSEGAALRQWGSLVGEQPAGLDDDDYRRFIMARILANKSDCTTEEILTIWRMVVDPETLDVGTVDIREASFYPAMFKLEVIRDIEMTAVYRRRVGRLMRDAKPMGITLRLVEAERDFFGFAEDTRDGRTGFDAAGKLARTF
jgi:hypothetical protein